MSVGDRLRVAVAGAGFEDRSAAPWCGVCRVAWDGRVGWVWWHPPPVLPFARCAQVARGRPRWGAVVVRDWEGPCESFFIILALVREVVLLLGEGKLCLGGGGAGRPLAWPVGRGAGGGARWWGGEAGAWRGRRSWVEGSTVGGVAGSCSWGGEGALGLGCGAAGGGGVGGRIDDCGGGGAALDGSDMWGAAPDGRAGWGGAWAGETWGGVVAVVGRAGEVLFWLLVGRVLFLGLRAGFCSFFASWAVGAV